MKKAFALLFSILMLQSCYTYKSTSYNNMKIGKDYIIERKNSGKKTEARFVSHLSDTILVETNRAMVKFPLSKIQSIKRKKVSALVLVGGIVVGAAGLIALITSYKGLPIPPQVVPTN